METDGFTFAKNLVKPPHPINKNANSLISVNNRFQGLTLHFTDATIPQRTANPQKKLISKPPPIYIDDIAKKYGYIDDIAKLYSNFVSRLYS